MFVEYDFMIIKRISIREMYKRKVQLLVLCDPDSNTELHYLVNYKIDLSKFKRNDKVRVKLGVSRKGASNVPHYFIKSIERVILKGKVVAYV
ncbi:MULTISPECIES: hypothetical protein [Enterococcus]|uniref:hypothetical protein n=1 Tax=Enterococcus TaxID=1350 RepID=UPI001156CA4D|nr:MULTISPECIES: hypothetical protein [Enterococcus]MBE9880206.1 hypothetical protein [Enterococcus casseliflavus]